jgi:hypothetical protein
MRSPMPAIGHLCQRTDLQCEYHGHASLYSTYNRYRDGRECEWITQHIAKAAFGHAASSESDRLISLLERRRVA